MAKYDDMSFGKAFAAARKEKGAGKTFMWKGNKYTTNYKEEEGKGTKPRSPAPTPRPKEKAPSAPPARPTSMRTSGGPAGGSTADRAANTSEAKVQTAIESARSALASARETKGRLSGRAARGGGNAEDIRPSLSEATARVDDLVAKAKDDPRTYLDDLRRAIRSLRSIIKSGGLSERENRYRGLRSDGPMFEGMSGNSGTTGSRSRAESRMAKGGMAKKGYAKGGMVKANCGASMKPNRKAKK